MLNRGQFCSKCARTCSRVSGQKAGYVEEVRDVVHAHPRRDAEHHGAVEVALRLERGADQVAVPGGGGLGRARALEPGRAEQRRGGRARLRVLREHARDLAQRVVETRELAKIRD